MKYARVSNNNNISWGVLSDDQVELLEISPVYGIKKTGGRVPLINTKLLAPVEPSKIILAGLNYFDHARELNMQIPDEPVIFMKPPTSVIGPSEDIVLPEWAGRIDYEAELAFIISKKGKNIPQNLAKDYIFGYTCLNDVTARDIQSKDGQWTRAKSFDSFCPIGPWVVTDIDPSKLRVISRLNGKIMQDSSTSNFIFSISCLISFISRIMTLMPGDVISTGTPPGVGPMKPGDTVEVDIEGVGKLINRAL